jgi:hypothetical protein
MYKHLAAVLLLLAAAPAFAAIPAFTDVDADKDGMVTQSEAVVAGISQSLFAKLDQDKDSKLSAEEYKVLTDTQG